MIGPILEVRGLRTALGSQGRAVHAVDGVNLHVDRGEIVALVGESGSGKTVLLRSLLGLAPERPGVVAGQVILRIGTHELRPYDDLEAYLSVDSQNSARTPRVDPRFFGIVERRVKPIRGGGVGLVLQNGTSALDPLKTVGAQLRPAVRDGDPGRSVRATVHWWLERLGFTDPEAVSAAYPHELSGGMAQRVMLGVVLARRPALLLLDEFTTGLDVTLQASIIQLLRELHEQLGFAALLVTHDLALARSVSHRTVIMRSGRLLQAVSTQALFDGRVTLAPYTSELLKNSRFGPVGRPELVEDLLLGGRASQPPRIQAVGVSRSFREKRLAFYEKRKVHAVLELSLTIRRGECVAVVGESGSGKTTLSHLLLGLIRPDTGTIRFDGVDLDDMRASARAAFIRQRALLFQNPYTSLNPEMTATDVVAESLKPLKLRDGRSAKTRARALLEGVGLRERSNARVAELSGGERRRLGLLKVLQSHASLLVLDEPTAGLDTILRHAIAKMVWESRARQPDRSVLIVGHDLGFVTRVADRIVVLYRGALVEDVPVTAFMVKGVTHHPYTQRLWDSARYVAGELNAIHEASVSLTPNALTAKRGPASRSQLTSGCLYRAHCPIYRSTPEYGAQCELVRPELRQVAAGRNIACHGVSP